jgi:hypothetical protein
LGDKRKNRGTNAAVWARNNALGLVAIFIALVGSALAAQIASHPSRTVVVASAPSRATTQNAQKAARGKRGPRGPAGPQGPAGQQGPQGAQGAQGLPGTASACQGNGSGDTMVSAGAVCIDKYEVSIWSAAEGGTQITGAIPCNVNGQNCTNIFARSVSGVTPRANITWFQAQQALANVGKRLPTNADWQQAVAGTPDPGTDNGTSDCNVSPAGVGVVNTGSRSSCVSSFGANDMVGNLDEWVADWDEQTGGCANWPAMDFGTDLTCLGRAEGQASTRFPGALIRGGDFVSGTDAGPFAVFGGVLPSSSDVTIGFRGGR